MAVFTVSSSSPLALLTSSKLPTFEASIVAANEYGDSNVGKEYPWLQGKAVVEPYKFTTLTVKYDTKTYSNKVTFNWKITAPKDASTVSFSGATVSTTFTNLGAHSIEITAFDESGAKIGRMTSIAHCVYVKREVRSLAEEDRENFLDAMFTIWSVGTKKGREVYGNDYTGIDRFVSVHAGQATGEISCDHWHEGTGFLTHHLAQSLSFEMAIRTVDKRATLPYWDFTIEGEKILLLGIGPKAVATVSPIFTSTWFGSMDDLSHVKDSRWAHVPSVVATKSTDVRNSYGIIRAPWNNAKDRELVRHMSDVCGLEPVNKPVPTCATHFKVLNLTTLGAFQVDIAGYGHGTMHVNSGGVYGECSGGMSALYEKYADEMSETYTMTSLASAVETATGTNPGWHSEVLFNKKMMVEKYFHLEYFHIYRTLYRSQTCALDGKAEALQCPESCDEDTPESECVCTCAGIDKSTGNADFDWENLEPCLYASDTSKTIFQNVFSEEFRKDAITMFCSTGVKEGEMLESASPGDPLFWMIHPVLDRMLTAKRLSAVSEIKFGNYGRITAFDNDDWLEYSYYNTDEFTCSGHSMDDAAIVDLPLPKHLVDISDVNQDGVMSNIELFEAIDPTKEDGTTYIFDNFEWTHCDKSDSIGEDGFTTGYLDGVEGSGESSTTSATDGDIMTFSGGIMPGHWGGETYRDIKPAQMKQSMSMAERRAAIAAGLKPGKNLQKTPRASSVSDYDAVMSLLEKNTK